MVLGMVLLTIPIKMQAGGTLVLAASGPSETQCFIKKGGQLLWNDTGGFPASACRCTHLLLGLRRLCFSLYLRVLL